MRGVDGEDVGFPEGLRVDALGLLDMGEARMRSRSRAAALEVEPAAACSI